MHLVMGVLCYSRPVHTALTLAYAYANKSENTDLHFFYGIPESGPHKSSSLLSMLRTLQSAGFGELHFLPEAAPRNTGSNVDNLMHTLTDLREYDCFFKIDDDVIIGQGTDVELATLLLDPKLQEARVCMLAGQAVREHMGGPNPFDWDVKVGGRVVASRTGGACPMETYLAISKHTLAYLKAGKFRTGCESPYGEFGSYSQRLRASGAKTALVLYPHITMQHIGLNCTTGSAVETATRCWAPARCWAPIGKVIEVPHFSFGMWEHSHTNRTQKDTALSLIEALMWTSNHPAIRVVKESLERYTPGVNDVDLPPLRQVAPAVVRRRHASIHPFV